MTELPSGTVTFLFTDLEGSTRLLKELGKDSYDDVLGEHRRLLRAAFAAHEGKVVDTQGDSFFVAFRTAADAVAAAVDAQRDLAAAAGRTTPSSGSAWACIPASRRSARSATSASACTVPHGSVPAATAARSCSPRPPRSLPRRNSRRAYRSVTSASGA